MSTAYARGLGATLPSIWQSARWLVAGLQPMPDAALHWWAAQPAGHLVITADEERYEIDGLALGERTVHAVSLIPLRAILHDPGGALIRALLPLDHLLGCHGEASGRWLSAGGGVDARWQRVGQAIAQLFRLGYGLSEGACQQPQLYLAEGLVTAIRDPQRLNTADPKLHRLLQSSLLSAPFWRRFQRDETVS